MGLSERFEVDKIMMGVPKTLYMKSTKSSTKRNVVCWYNSPTCSPISPDDRLPSFLYRNVVVEDGLPPFCFRNVVSGEAGRAVSTPCSRPEGYNGPEPAKT